MASDQATEHYHDSSDDSDDLSSDDSSSNHNTGMVFRPLLFQRIVQDILKNDGKNLRMQSSAIMALQKASEMFLLNIFQQTTTAPQTRSHTLYVEGLTNARKVMSELNGGEGERLAQAILDDPNIIITTNEQNQIAPVLTLPSIIPQQNAGNCVICMDHGQELLFLPCAHVCCCKECGTALTKCPVCRTTIKNHKRCYPC